MSRFPAPGRQRKPNPGGNAKIWGSRNEEIGWTEAQPIPTLKSQRLQQLQEPPPRLRPAHPKAPPPAPSRPAESVRTSAIDKPLPRTPTAEPAALSGQRGPESISPDAARGRPGVLPRPLTVGPSAGRRQARVGGCGPPSSNPGRSPYSEPIEAQQLCLQGLSPARTLEKHFRGSGGGKSFGTGTARGLELPGPPKRGGAGRSGAGLVPVSSVKPPPDSSLTLSAPRPLASPSDGSVPCCSSSYSALAT